MAEPKLAATRESEGKRLGVMMQRVNAFAMILLILGLALQVGGLWMTVRQVQLVIGIRAAVRQQARTAHDKVLGRKPATVDSRVVRVRSILNVHAHGDVDIPGESEVDKLRRDVKHHAKLIAELDRKFVEADLRTKDAIEDRLDELDRETEKKSKRNAALMMWGVVLIGLGVAAQTVSSILSMLASR